MKFYKCRNCKDIMIVVEGDRVPTCCGEDMEELIPGSVEAAVEKHIPVVSLKDEYKITVGEVNHPMQEEHYIECIIVEFEDGGVKVFDLKPNQEPTVTYKTDKTIKAVYACCNLHGLWKAEL